MPRCILSGQGRSTFTEELADGRYIRIDSGGLAIVDESIGAGPYTITFNEEEEGDTPSGGITEAEADAKYVPLTRTINGEALSSDITLSAEDVNAVPTTRTINGQALSSDISLTANDVGARSDTWLPTAEEIGARPNTWTPTAEEVGARPSTWTPTAEDIGAMTETQADGKYLPLAGGTLTGSLTLSGEPTTNLQAATKAYVDTSIQSAILDSWEASY